MTTILKTTTSSEKVHIYSGSSSVMNYILPERLKRKLRVLTKIGEILVMEPTEEICDRFELADKLIHSFIRNHSQKTHHRVNWRPYMIGETEEKSRPTIIFWCEDQRCRKCRQMIVNGLTAERTLAEYFPEFRLEQASRRPDFGRIHRYTSGEGVTKHIRGSKAMKENEVTQPPGFFGLPGYPYQKIESHKRRMVDLEPGQFGDDLRISFTIESNYFGCEGFSYVEADGLNSSTEILNVGQDRYEIPGTLGDELRKLRLKDKRRLIWIDVLCIDPSDSDELRPKYVSVPPWEDTKQSSEARRFRTKLSVLGIKALVHDNWNGRGEVPITLGGLVLYGVVPYILTAGHAFLSYDTARKETRKEGTLEANEEDFFEWSIDGGHTADASNIKHNMDLLEDLGKKNAATGVLDGRETFPDSSSNPSSPVAPRDCLRIVITYPCQAAEYITLRESVLTSLDFTILRIQLKYKFRFQDMIGTNRPNLNHYKPADPEFKPALTVKKKTPAYPVVAVLGSSGVVRGSISSTPTSVYDPSTSTFTELWTAHLEGEVVRGDCGSWVLDSETGCLLGHIVSGSSDMGGVNIVPAKEIFDSFERLTDEKLSLFVDDLSQYEIYPQSTSDFGIAGFLNTDLKQHREVIHKTGERDYITKKLSNEVPTYKRNRQIA